MSKMEPYQPKVLLLFALYIFLLFPCGAKLVHSYSPPLAATFFISPGGSDSNPGTESQPFLTFTKAFSSMQGGDELVLLDGVYSPDVAGFINSRDACTNCEQPPSGVDLNNQTIVRAKNPGAVIINGPLRLGTKNISGKKSYILIKGITFEGGGHLYNTSYVTVKECGFHSVRNSKGSVFGIGTIDHNYHNTYNLIEDCWIWGMERIIAINYRADYNVWRRVVVRNDGCTSTNCEGSGNPNVGFTFYNSSYCSAQNVIVLDRLPTGLSSYTDFATAQHDPGSISEGEGEMLGPNEWLGCISLGSEGHGFNLEADRANPNTHRLQNIVAWNSREVGVNLNNYEAFNVMIENVTAGVSGSSNIRVGPAVSGGTVRNCLTYQAGRCGISSIIAPRYTNVYGASSSSYCQNPCSVGCLSINPIEGNSPALKYITRIEEGSLLKGTGEDGADYGANVVSKYGVDGTRYGEPGYNTLTSEPVWPWPNEDKIKSFMCAEAGVTRGFCAAETLTKYIWEYLGSPIPPEIYGVDNEPPSAPSAVTATAISESQINLAWNASADNNGVAGYRVDVSTAPSFGSLLPDYNNKDLGNVTQAGITGLDPQTTYYARLRAYDFAQNFSADSATASATTLPPQPQQVTLQQNLNGYIGVKDTRVSFYDPNINFGNDTKMLILGGSENVKALVRFDLSSIPAGAIISSATLSLYNYSHQPSISSGTVSVHQITKPWVETQATWNIYSTGNSWAAAGMQAGADYRTSPASSIPIDTAINVWRNFDVTAMVQQWVNGSVVNNGFVVRSSTSGVKPHFYSSNYLSDISLRPKLTLIYRPR